MRFDDYNNDMYLFNIQHNDMYLSSASLSVFSTSCCRACCCCIMASDICCCCECCDLIARPRPICDVCAAATVDAVGRPAKENAADPVVDVGLAAPVWADDACDWRSSWSRACCCCCGVVTPTAGCCCFLISSCRRCCSTDDDDDTAMGWSVPTRVTSAATPGPLAVTAAPTYKFTLPVSQY